jgi:hypothetical protein
MGFHNPSEGGGSWLTVSLQSRSILLGSSLWGTCALPRNETESLPFSLSLPSSRVTLEAWASQSTSSSRPTRMPTSLRPKASRTLCSLCSTRKSFWGNRWERDRRRILGTGTDRVRPRFSGRRESGGEGPEADHLFLSSLFCARVVNQTALLRYNYFDIYYGTLKESIEGGSHVRYWRQNGTLANSGAWFVSASVEMAASENHMIVDNG